MAFEATIIELLGNGGDPISVTVADGTTIEKGSLLTLTDPRTGAAQAANTTTTDGFIVVGIAAAEKVANDGSTTLAAYTNGIFDIKSSGAITVGKWAKAAGANHVIATLSADLLSGTVIGRALETSSDAEVIAVRVLL